MKLRDYLRGDLWGGVFHTRKWPVVAFGAVAIAFGLWGFSTCHAADCQTQSFAEKLFRTLDLIRMTSRFTPDKHPWPLVIAQLMMPLALVAGAIRLFILNIRRDLKVVLVRRLHGHMIVCGLGDTGLNIAQQLAAAGKRVVAISLDNQDANALACERRGILVLRGDGMEQALLEVAGVHRAAAMFLTCGSDAVNIEIALRTNASVGKRGPTDPLHIWVELRHDWLYDAIISHRNRATVGNGSIIRLFNLHANAARLLLRSAAFMDAMVGTDADGELLLIGEGLTLNEIVVQVLQGPFAIPGGRHSVTLLSAPKSETRASLIARFPGVTSIEGFAVQDLKNDDSGLPDVGGKLAIKAPAAAVVEFTDEVETMRVALNLRDRLDRLGHYRVPVFVRIWRQAKLGGYLQALEGPSGELPRLIPFGDLEALTAPEQLLAESIDRLAIATHNVYRDTTAGGSKSPPWPELSEAMKQSNRDFADHIATKLRLTPLQGSHDPAAVELLAEMEHLRWSRALRLRAWQQGPRDVLGRRHPLLVDWSDLDEAARETNREMVRRIPQILAQANDGTG
jgi:voltage-gated potassium channel Kch